MPFTATVNLSSLDGTNGFRLDGEAANNWIGRSVASAGDVNGDGFADLIIGFDYFRNNSGACYVAFGKAGGFASAINLFQLYGSSGFMLQGFTADDYSGGSVASAGDVNGDGFDDLIVGAKGADPNGSASGASYLVFGKASGFPSVTFLSSLNGNTGFKLAGVSAGDNTGASVAAAGDVNGDGFADFIIGAPGSNGNAGTSYIVFGKANGFASSIELSSLDGTTGFRLDGVSAQEYSGSSVASAGDVNGDGYADLIIGAAHYYPFPYTYSGASYVIFGKSGGFQSSMNLSSLNGNNGFKVAGVSVGDLCGASVASAGDVNGDGYADLIIGAYQADPNGNSNSGASYVVFGKAGGFAPSINLTGLNGSNGFRLNGFSAGDLSGQSVASAGDVNGDGFDDLIIGAPYANTNGTSSGASYLLFGKASGFASSINLSSLNGSDGLRLDGAHRFEDSGSSVASAGDVDGDGFADLIIGSPGASANFTYAGASYIYFSPATGAALYRGTTLADTICGTPDGDTMNGYGQNDKLNGNAGNDTISGGTGNDSIDGGDGTDLALLPGPQSAYRIGIRDNQVITSGPDGQDQYVNIEAFQWDNSAPISLATLQASAATTGLLYAALAGKPAAFILPDRYTGPVPGLTNQLLATATNDVVSGTTDNDFINTLAGDDAVDGGAGNDVIDGGLGSNFLTGAAGLDIFFVDGRGASTASTWATITDFSSGEQVTIWGYKPGISNFTWVANDGAAGFKGATFHADLDGNGLIDTSLTFAGLSQAQLPTQSFGTVGGYDYLLFG